MKIFVHFWMIAAAMLGAVLLVGGNTGAQVATTSEGNIYSNAVVVAPAVAVQPNQINNVNNNITVPVSCRRFFPKNQYVA